METIRLLKEGENAIKSYGHFYLSASSEIMKSSLVRIKWKRYYFGIIVISEYIVHAMWV